MNTIRLRTPFEVSDKPLSEYPRPQFARDSYLNLNGYWDYAVCSRTEEFPGWQGKILVPYSPECLLSGLPEGMEITPSDVLYYRLKFKIEAGFLKAHTFLHFDAVDCACRVYLNDKELGTHVGGYTPFTFDVTDIAKEGANTLQLVVTDPSDTSYHSRGKQRVKHGGIWYTPQSGIWQTVWLESVPETYLRDMTIIPDIDRDKLIVRLDIAGKADSVNLVVSDGRNALVNQKAEGDTVVIDLPEYELWSPENPKLYDLYVNVGEDVVRSYFGMRKFSVVTDRKGFRRLALNNKPYFHTGVLDQGYWSDGMLTPPSNAALEYDVKLVKSMGFNMIRKHIKIEPLRWYYHCDREGILVWQDMVSGGTPYKFAAIGALPFIGIHLKDNRYKFFSRADEEGRREFEREMLETVNRLKNCVSVAMWVIFNEGWGQFDSVEMTKKLAAVDNTRVIDSVSGWHDQGEDTSQLKSLHVYFKPVRIPDDKRCIVLSEFGGYSLPTEGHMFNPTKLFGYKKFKTQEAFAAAFEKLYDKQVIPKIAEGLSAAVYTQVSDVEEEINGLVTYDRRVIKLPREVAQRVNAQLKY